MHRIGIKYVLIAVAILLAVAYSARLEAEQAELSAQLIRLRVVANSNSGIDQAYKMEIRDRVLADIAPILDGSCNRTEALERLNAALPTLAEGYPDCEIMLRQQYFPEREYDTFTLPAGEYASMQVTIGEGDGKNWWCVLFPPLCIEAASAEDMDTEDAFAMLSDEQIELIKGTSGEYRIKFRILDIIAEIKLLFGVDNWK